MERACVWGGHVYGEGMCMGRTCVWGGHVYAEGMCMGRTCVWGMGKVASTSCKPLLRPLDGHTINVLTRGDRGGELSTLPY